MEAGNPHARYAVADDTTETWQVDLRTVEYDWQAAARTAQDHHRPDVARVLLIGRV